MYAIKNFREASTNARIKRDWYFIDAAPSFHETG